MTPPSEPIAKARIDSHKVITRCFQITPEENHVTIWLPTSTGLEKKNGGSSIFPNTGTEAKNCHSARATIATSNCNERSPILDMLKLLSFPPICPGSRFGESADQTGGGLGVAVQRLEQLFATHACLQGSRLEICSHQSEDITMGRAGRRAGSEIARQLHRALAAEIFFARLCSFAFSKSGDRERDAIGHPMAHAARRTAIDIKHQKRVALGPRRRVRPGQGG